MRIGGSRLGWSVVVVLLCASCGGSAASGQPRVEITVLAAASLKNTFPRIGQAFTEAHPGVAVAFSFAGTDQLTAQIEQGAPADVFAGASTRYGDQLASESLIAPPRPFCTNSLVLVVPASNPGGIGALEDVARPGVKLVIGAASVPIGSYTRTVLANLDASLGDGFSSRALANVVSDEDNVEGVLTKVELGEADAGFVYVTDATAAGGRVRAIHLSPDAQAVATYSIAVVRATEHPAEAAQFAADVLGGPAQRILHEAGFGPPPAS